MKNKWEILSLGPLPFIYSLRQVLSLRFYIWRAGPCWLPIERVECRQSVFCAGLCCGQEGFGGSRRFPFPYREPLSLEANTGGNPASTRHCTSPFSEGCAVGWAAAERAAGRSRHCFLQVTGGRRGPWACPRGFVTAQIQCPAWGLRNRFHVFYWLLQFPFVVLSGSSNRAVVALIPTWVFCLLVCFLPSSRTYLFFFFHIKREKKMPRQIGPLFLWGKNIY